MRYDLNGKVVLVTGGSAGIGRATAEAFALAGAKVALVARNEAALERAVRQIRQAGGLAHAFPFNLVKIDELPNLVARIAQQLGPVDVLVNNAGIFVGGLVQDCPLDAYRENFEINFFACLKLIQSVLPEMKRRRSGQIINISSCAGTRATPAHSAYCSTKFALNGLTESLRLEVQSAGIDVILISPGPVESELHARASFYGRWRRGDDAPKRALSAERMARMIVCASRHRRRSATTPGSAFLLHHLNYWVPELLDWVLLKRFRKNLSENPA